MSNSIYLDTAPIIYALDDVAPFSAPVQDFIFSQFENDAKFVSSAIVNTEYLVLPYKLRDLDKLREFERFKSLLGITIIAADDVITKEAAKIRAKYESIKSMDSIHLASAIVSGCDLFLTNDKQLRQVKEVRVLLVSELCNKAGTEA